MTDNTDTPTVEPPENYERDEMVTDAVNQAKQYHTVMDSAKAWARDTSADLLVEAALADDENEAEEIEQIAALVRTVVERIEQGDNSRARAFQ